MIEYEFAADYWNPIARKIKIKTLRNFRIGKRRHARVDEPIELWAVVGGRRMQIRKAVCTAIEGVTLDLSRGAVAVGPIFKNRATWRRLGKAEREQLAIDTGHADWRSAAQAYAMRYGEDIWNGTLLTWGDREYEGPIPSRQQLRDLAILAQHKAVIPYYGKISPTVGHSLLILGWAEVPDKSSTYHGRGDNRGMVPIRISDKGRWILDRFEK